MTTDHPLEGFPLTPAVRQQTSEQPVGELDARRGDLDPTHLRLELHVARVLRFDGDWYSRCSCDAISLAMSSEVEANEWLCPREAAEAQVAYTKTRWEAAQRAVGGR